jgi:hypothetical protein
MEWSFNFDDGFTGTDSNDKEFYVTVYFPAPNDTLKRCVSERYKLHIFRLSSLSLR